MAPLAMLSVLQACAGVDIIASGREMVAVSLHNLFFPRFIQHTLYM